MITVKTLDEQFIFTEADGKWTEQYWVRTINDNDEAEWKLFHTVSPLKKEDVEQLAEKLEIVGFERG